MKFKITTAVLALTITLTTQNAFTAEQVYRDTTWPALGHFQEDASLINECLNHVSSAELHFYWTTGRDISLQNPEYGENLTVDVGGAEYGQKFPCYVGELLRYLPDKLKVKFTCDTMTYNSNEVWISSLIQMYGERFECLGVDNVHATLSKKLPDQQPIINSICKNATGGNPAIPSDGYRVYGMPLGRDLPLELILQTQYTYCDIDAFCFGMESSEGHTDLIKALFSEPILKKPKQSSLGAAFTQFDPTTTFYLGRRKEWEGKGNDLIKLRIINLEDYTRFCERVLIKMSELNSKKKLELLSDHGVLTYFSELHAYIKGCEEDPEGAFGKYLA